jgi:hypothetical protein
MDACHASSVESKACIHLLIWTSVKSISTVITCLELVLFVARMMSERCVEPATDIFELHIKALEIFSSKLYVPLIYRVGPIPPSNPPSSKGKQHPSFSYMVQYYAKILARQTKILDNEGQRSTFCFWSTAKLVMMQRVPLYGDKQTRHTCDYSTFDIRPLDAGHACSTYHRGFIAQVLFLPSCGGIIDLYWICRLWSHGCRRF